MATTLSNDGRLTIPAHIRKRHGFKPGDLFQWVDDGENLYVVPVPVDAAAALQGSAKGTGLYDLLMEERRRERARDEAKFANDDPE